MVGIGDGCGVEGASVGSALVGLGLVGLGDGGEVGESVGRLVGYTKIRDEDDKTFHQMMCMSRSE